MKTRIEAVKTYIHAYKNQNGHVFVTIEDEFGIETYAELSLLSAAKLVDQVKEAMNAPVGF